MRDLKRYWREVRELERNLPPFVWLVAGELMVEVPASYAAKLMHAGSHRAATAEEIAEHKAKQAAQERHDFHEALRRKGITIIPMMAAEPAAEPAGRGRRGIR